MRLYVIYDRLAEECAPVWEAPNDAVARRMFKHLWEKQGAGLLEEFWLFCVGEIDRRSMVIMPLNERVEIAVAEVKDGEA